MEGRGGRRGWLAFAAFVGLMAAGRLTPAVRWYFRQRAQKVVEEVGRRGIKLPSFKLTRRRALIHRLTHDPELIGAAEAYARENGISMASALARAERYAREIVPSFNAFLYFRMQAGSRLQLGSAGPSTRSASSRSAVSRRWTRVKTRAWSS